VYDVRCAHIHIRLVLPYNVWLYILSRDILVSIHYCMNTTCCTFLNVSFFLLSHFFAARTFFWPNFGGCSTAGVVNTNQLLLFCAALQSTPSRHIRSSPFTGRDTLVALRPVDCTKSISVTVLHSSQ
jgi:hypothetical protein